MKRKLLTFIIILCTFFVQQNLRAQATVLAPGDIAFIGFQTGTPTDGFSFITLKDINAGTLVYFTEDGWGNGAWISSNPETHLLWTVPAFTPAGKIISIVETSADTFAVTGTTGVTLALNTGFNLPNAGDQILAYQSSTGPEPASPTFIAGIHGDYNSTTYDPVTTWNNAVSANLFGGSESSLPPGLTNGVNCISLFPGVAEMANSKYIGTLTGTVTELLAKINNPSSTYWSHSTGTTDLGIVPSNYPTPILPTVVVATVSTTTATSVKAVSAVMGGNVTAHGGEIGVQRGIVWATTAAPTIADHKVQNGTGTGGFSTTITGLPSGTIIHYRAYATNNAGTSYGTELTLTTGAALGTSSTPQTNESCNGGSNATATVNVIGGTPSYTYLWSNGATTATVTGLGVGPLSVTVTDSELTQITRNYTIVQPSTLNGTLSVTNVSCFGGANGTATITAFGGTPAYTYLWSNGATTATATGLLAGTYSLTITDANSCTRTVNNIIVGQPAAIFNGTPSVTNVSCFGGSNGTATITASGGTPFYTYLWSNGATTATATGLLAGTYSVTITDANSCTRTVNNIIVGGSASIISGTPSTTSVSCNGGSNGTATILVSGGTPGYTYLWSNGATTASATGLLAGTYSVTITDANSCTRTVNSIIVGQPSVINATPSQINVSCNGGANASATVTPTGGTGAYTYLWSNGATTASISGLTSGAYSVTITDANLCQRIQNFTISQPPVLAATQGTINNVSCNGGSNGTATVVVSGGTSGYTYSWAPTGGTAATASGLAQGTYTVSVTDANACQTTQSFTITEPNAFSVTPSQVNILCNGDSTGEAGVTVTGGTGAYTYSWSPSSAGTANTATGLTAGVYVVTVTDANNCSQSKTFTITEPLQPLVASQGPQTNINCFGDTYGSATVNVAGGAGGYTYSWSPSGGTGVTASGLSAGNYTVTIFDANGCMTSQAFTIAGPGATLSAATSSTPVSCFNGANGTASVNVSGGTTNYSYSWTPSGGTGATASGLSAGDYTCTITDSKGCTLSKTVTVGTPAPLSGTIAKVDVSCNGGSNGSATVTPSGGVGSYTYTWSPSGGNATTASGLSQGTYTVMIQDGNSCTHTESVTINEPSTLSVTPSQTNVLCNGASNGTATVSVSGGTPRYTYVWSPSGGTAAIATGLSVGNYDCVVTDAKGCTFTQSFYIGQPAIITATTATVSATCTTNGQASVTPSGGTTPYTYLWSPSGATTQLATGLVAGNHSVFITDANGCTLEKNFTINTTNTLVATTSQTDVLCNGSNTGSATVVPSGAPGPFTYVWAPAGGNADTANNLTPGNYVVTVTSANGCSTTKSFTITQPSALVVTPSQTNLSCNGGSNGSASVNVTGGTGIYTYSWSPSGGTAATATGLSAGTYTATVTDVNNCTATQSFTITEPTALTATISSTDINCNGGTNGSATATVTGRTGTYTYSWAPTGGTAATATGLSAGTYTVTVTDANGCTTAQSITITEPTPLVASIGAQTDVTCNGLNNGSATVNATGGTGTYTYSWSPSGGTAATASGLSPGTYTVIVKDANNCTATQSFTIIEPTVLTASATTQTNVSCNSGSDGSATVTATGGSSTYTYLWAPSGGTTDTATGLTAGTYTVTVTDAKSCTTTQSFTILEPQVLEVVSTQKNVTCYNANNGEATVAISGGTPPYFYKWSNSDSTNQSAQNLAMGNYICTITDSNDCTINQSFTITQPTNPIDLVASLPTELTPSSVTLTINASRKGIDGDQGECTSEIGLVFSTVSNPTISDSKIILGNNLGTFTKVIEALLGNTVYYLRPYSIGKFGYINYGNEISFTTQKYVLKVVATPDQTKVFGNTEPILTYVATGFANGDNNSIITGLLSRDTGENAGTYPITLGSLSGGTNYRIDFKTSDFIITKANQIIDWNQELAFGCDTSDQLQLNAFSDSGLPVSYVVENSSIADVQGDILKINSPGTTAIKVSQEGDQNHNAASQITKSIEVSQFGNISQHWEDVLFFDNSSQKYSAFQWYKDGAIIPGANSQYYTEKPLKGIYSFQAKDENGKDIKFCPLTLEGQSFSRAIKLYPNPVQSLKEFTIEFDYSVEQLKGSVINIYDLSGRLVSTVNNVSSKVVVLAPSSSGIYVVILSLENGQHKTVNLLVR